MSLDLRARTLASYISGGHRSVKGWLNPTAIHVVVELAKVQDELGIRGPAVEIGVHHGRLFILLHLLTGAQELSVAWDLFERQDENADRSGRGDRDRLMANLERHGCDLSRIKILTGNSLSLTAPRLLDESGARARLFSIDGGHTAATTRHDLALAQQTLCDGGIVIVDDMFNPSWPGVAEGVYQWLASPDARLFPVVIAGNKLVLTNEAATAATYISRLSAAGPEYLQKRSAMAGHEVLILTRYAKSWPGRLAGSRAWRTIRNWPVGRQLRRRFGTGT